MILLVKNKLYRVLALSRMLNSFGAYIYNMVFVVYAASQFQSTWAVSVANMVMVVPTIFTLFVGMQADKTKQKARMIVVTAFLQAGLFWVMSFVMQSTTLGVFAFICLINIVVDILSDYSSGLRLPIMQKNIPAEDLMEAYSFLQFVVYMCSLAGQATGIWLLNATHQNFGLVACINALFFALSGLVLFFSRTSLTHEEVAEVEGSSFKQEIASIFENMKLIFEDGNSANFIAVLCAILALNALGGSIGSIYNLYFLQEQLFGVSYAQSLLVINVVIVGSMIAGSLTPKDYFAGLPITKLMVLNALVFALTGLVNSLGFHPIFGIATLAFGGYLTGKVNPKIDALLLANTSPEMLARTNNLLSMLFTLSLPVGTVVFSTLAGVNMVLCWSCFLGLSLLAIYLSTRTTSPAKYN